MSPAYGDTLDAHGPAPNMPIMFFALASGFTMDYRGSGTTSLAAAREAWRRNCGPSAAWMKHR
ncbi:hypothetical protein ABZ646_21175 [Streptomyces sp. NPDC007162]|uniref:hypothetical protein n=1 Tax=Streptomyces sp. NPDC007162 TaxID=3156917 RepID=UPI0033FD478B